MGVLTDFFVASPEQLREAFPAWLEVAERPELREVENLFTRQMQQVEYWPPKVRPTSKVSDGAALGNIRHLPHAEFKSIDPVKVATLHELVSGEPFETCLGKFDRPALIDPRETDEDGLHKLDAGFVQSLASLSEDDLSQTAADWAATEEMELDHATSEDCAWILLELTRLAKEATATGRDMYYSWSL